MSKRILIVGAGFAGAVYARELAMHGYGVDVIDRRPHVAGNAFDQVSPEGIRVHVYGPHLFHTNNEKVVRWIGQFGEFVHYEHRVQALLADGRCVPLPINRTTINLVFGVNLVTPEQASNYLSELAVPTESPRNAADWLNSRIGIRLTDLLFRPYTRKMWNLDLEDLAADVVRRVPLRLDAEDRYFAGDRFQILPKHGYERLFQNILDHPRIRVTLNQPFDKTMLNACDHVFSSMAIDEFFDYRFGALPYRSIRFHHRAAPAEQWRSSASVLNFTDDGPRTRETDWQLLPFHREVSGPSRTLTQEEPCDYGANNNERYYPVKTSDGRHQRVYEQYKKLAETVGNVNFIGRCGTYQYLDMHQVINQCLVNVGGWLRSEGRT
jgi:UDP-galactopyranose mutase